MIPCCVCARPFDPAATSADPAVQAGLHLAREQYRDEGQICLQCLENRGRLALMYCTEMFD